MLDFVSVELPRYSVWHAHLIVKYNNYMSMLRVENETMHL